MVFLDGNFFIKLQMLSRFMYKVAIGRVQVKFAPMPQLIHYCRGSWQELLVYKRSIGEVKRVYSGSVPILPGTKFI